MSHLLAIDRWGLLLIHRTLDAEPFGTIFGVISRMGDWAAVWLALCAAVLWVGHGDEEGHRTIVLTLAALLASEVVVVVLKVIVARPRPADVIPQLETLRLAAGGFSFPSAHATRSFAAAGVLSSYFRRGRWSLWLLAALIALSRVVVGVHYPLDVVFGALLGMAIAWLLLRAGASWRPRTQPATSTRGRRPAERDA